ncbi:aspartyl-tRNA synthetase [Saitoella complicata NRRL Y-17804]|uniref:aspartyl-tRNA synthetase n=1 Tax=Saitoella complicata (strain BCRC 22490 / CBS 7301 / JCM 7358 / NBRC 10748 / NRRL Y-17804) TaxID=698492 RepID=UPI000867F2C0|nr:aspartyl-tRNA synthetase [Saitoella complicata NRRL Y-17804]ODQ51305.1 aspartyl-tRNA synthetase [Saitoella complicata NRRL Y-17804]
MPLLSKTLQKLHLKHSPSPSQSSGTHYDDSSDDDTPEGSAWIGGGKSKQKRLERKREKKRQAHHRALDLQTRRQREDAHAAKVEPASVRALYGRLPFPVPENVPAAPVQEWTSVGAIEEGDVGEGDEVTFRARVHARRVLNGKGLVFFVVREGLGRVQAVLKVEREGGVEPVNAKPSPHMLSTLSHLSPESIVLITGTLQKPPHGDMIKSCTIQHLEVKVRGMWVLAEARGVPVRVRDLERPRKGAPGEEEVPLRTRMANRVLDLRTPSSLAIFRIQSGICNLFRTHLTSLSFTEIHTPKLQHSATESGASVFSVPYFGRRAFLAQSPQLAKQMSISAGMGRVFEVGPVFRAEESNTRRHLTEYVGLDLEMEVRGGYEEMLGVVDGVFKKVFAGVYEKFAREVEVVREVFGGERLVWAEETVVLPFREGVRMLNESGWRDESGKELSDKEDLGTRDEIRLGALVKERYGTDYFVLDKFPKAVRPFYTMPDPENGEYTNSFDIFLRGQEILTGGQRIHDPDMLEEAMRANRIRPDSMREYLDAFRWGVAPHAGAGIGLERLVMLFLGLGNIRYASLFPRDPKSLQEVGRGGGLRYPEVSTVEPPWEANPEKEEGEEKFGAMPLEKLIGNYGDASNTSWLEPRFEVWRHQRSGAAVGFVEVEGHAMVVGNPLCDERQYGEVIGAFLTWLGRDGRALKPIWLLVSKEVEEILGGRGGWRTLSCVAEERVKDPAENVNKIKEGEVGRKLRHAKQAGIKITDLPAGEPVPEEWRKRCDQRIQDWIDNRKGKKQVHLTDVHPWQDMEHRRYFVAETAEGEICAMVVLAELSLKYGYQVKWSLDFPGAPSGAIEYITLHALTEASSSGARSVTFGATATNHFVVGSNLSGLRAKFLSKTYHGIATQFNLAGKGEFRAKLGAEEDPLWVCYPKHGMGPGGVKAVMKFVGGEEHLDG